MWLASLFFHLRSPQEIEQAGICSRNYPASVMPFLSSVFPRWPAETGKELFWSACVKSYLQSADFQSFVFSCFISCIFMVNFQTLVRHFKLLSLKKTSDRWFFFPNSFRASPLCLRTWKTDGRCDFVWKMWLFFIGAIRACYDFDQIGKINLYMLSKNLIEPNMWNLLKFLYWCLVFRFCILVLEGYTIE